MNLLDVVLPEATNHNHLIAAVNNRVFHYAGQDFFWRYSTPKAESWVKVDLLFAGQTHTLYVSTSMVDAVLSPLSLTFGEMSSDALKLWLLQMTPSMPEGLRITSLTAVEAPVDAWALEAHSYTNGESLGWQMASHATDLPIQGLVESLNPFCKGIMTSTLLNIPIQLPLIACSISVPATDIETLTVGDVFLLGEV